MGGGPAYELESMDCDFLGIPVVVPLVLVIVAPRPAVVPPKQVMVLLEPRFLGFVWW